MTSQYFLVFIFSLLVDILPFPLPPACTIMIFLQIKFHLDIWWVIFIGVSGSIIGRYLLTLYIPHLSGKIFNHSKNEDVQFLGSKMKNNIWKGQMLVLAWSLMPLPTTPLFLAAGMARLRPAIIIPAFTIGKLISDGAVVFMGKYAAENVEELVKGATSWKSILSLVTGLLLIFLLLFVDWRTLLREKKFSIKFNIWKGRGPKKRAH
jgi:membrane protein YqaA with SNARE-associated domain